VIRVLKEEASKTGTHGYQSYRGSPILRSAVSEWYNTWYNVFLDPQTEVLPLIGSKEGIVHICMTYLDRGDEVLIPNPGYPTYRSAVMLAGATPVDYLLEEGNSWYPDFFDIENRDISRVKMMIVNYPHMPTGQQADKQVFESLVRFASHHNILLVHDNPYSFILNKEPLSLLSIDGAKDCAIELNSLSKSHNMAGWRVGMLCAKKERINEVLQFKSNMDSGMFLPVQLAAARALTLGKEWYDELNEMYSERRIKIFELLDKLNCTYSGSQEGLFVWAKVPEKFKDGFALSDELLYQKNIFITPGGIFGTAGNKFIRVSLCSAKEQITEAMARL
jgi:aspartate/methionine/tyrosine aminotransferase